ncbi:MAG: SpoIIE family protein phosphatase [Spirochaetes bacterium]|nr:SpoIIE family protein phosphatase [Spirochaetota bacterium]
MIPIVFFIIMPFYFNLHEYTSLGFSGVFFLQILLNYSLSEKKQLTYGILYLRIFLWSLFMIIIFIPTYWFIKEILISDIISNDIMLYSLSIIFPFLFFILYRILRPAALKIINIRIKELKNIFEKVYRNISELSDMRKQKMDWDSFFGKAINSVCEILGIETALLYLFNEEIKVYELAHTYNINVELNEITAGSDLVAAFSENNIIEKTHLYTDMDLREHKDILLKFFDDNNMETALSVFSSNRQLLGLLLLGRLSGKNKYTPDFISFLDNYRIQFGILLENLIFSEEIRRTQVVKRDKMLVRNIKRKIIPVKFKDLEGLTISSLFMSNSELGGDYFNSARIGSDKLGIFISNTSDAGVESAMLALQMSGVFHAQADMHESPEGLLNVINKVICTSRFTEKYAAAFYMIYNESLREIEFSNAAFNPLVVFDPVKENFTEFDAEGIPIGIDMGFNYKHRTLSAFPNGLGLCYSQGLSAVIDKSGNIYSISRIKDIIRINKKDAPADLIGKIYDDIKNFAEGVKLLNDITLIIFKTA